MKNAITKAIEGGYGDWLAERYFSPTELAKFKGFIDRYSNPKGFEFYFEGVKRTYPNHWAMTTNTAGGIILTSSEITNHAEFWQALGKAMGWENGADLDSRWDYVKGKTTYHYFNDCWEFYWHRFIDHLAEGKAAESFFKEMLK